MRWLTSILLVVLAALLAAWALDNAAMVSVYWREWRIDLSLNLVILAGLALLALAVSGVWLVLGLRAAGARSRQWRSRQRERRIWSAVLGGVAHLAAGQNAKAQDVAHQALNELHGGHASSVATAARQDGLRVMANWVLAESANALGDELRRDSALAAGLAVNGAAAQAVQEGLRMRALAWALQRHDWPGAQLLWDALPQGLRKRALALRLRYRLLRGQGRSLQALDVLADLRRVQAVVPGVAEVWAAGLAVAALNEALDETALHAAWQRFGEATQLLPEVRMTWAQRRWALCAQDGRAALAPLLFDALQPVHRHLDQMAGKLRLLWLQIMETLLEYESKRALTWAATLQQTFVDDDWVQYIGAYATLRQGLWGNAQAALQRLAVRSDLPPALGLRVARCQAELAQQRGDDAAALEAYRRALAWAAP